MEVIKLYNNKLVLIDQTKLPNDMSKIECKTYKQVADAIVNMKVRGAPAIGIAAAYGILLAALEYKDKGLEEFIANLFQAASYLKATRPTAVNLSWAVDRLMELVDQNRNCPVEKIIRMIQDETENIVKENKDTDISIAQHGAKLLEEKENILTHCNAGALATAAYGTAIGVIRYAFEQGKDIKVFVDETRPLLQGARLTAWELVQYGIPATLITDNMAGYFMSKGLVTSIIVGADRIASNGDTANKIGTYSLAVLAKEHSIPFYIAAPFSSFDFSIETGDEIIIEERKSQEVTQVENCIIAPEGISVANPAFDVTPNRLITALITEHGPIYPPFDKNLEKFKLINKNR
ncbi:MAG: S-methyl-5-thioribose-1-phosphate isomerase [Eubacteriales bacterium]|nr:S-methyl-5-thioribose-1-phosphate isomerase [Clostridia bacterium]MDI9511666.1 S-methyl-5-thioribose-1-phosphate isomerase [Bacillota bacterium]